MVRSPHASGCMYLCMYSNVGDKIVSFIPPDIAVLPVPNGVSPQSEDATVRRLVYHPC